MTRTSALSVLALAGLAAPAAAQEAGPIDIEVPTVVTDTGGPTEGPAGPDDELDLANVVQSAAKGVTTVQEAPVIVTVITADEIADRQFQTIDQVLDTVPGYMRAGLIHSQFPTVTVRGIGQAVQLLHDSVSMFDPYVNVATFQRLQPLETIKRIETITGPGGVLWGANSFLGVVNIITKDAEDVDGVEVGGQLGDGNGDRKNGRVYVMAGLPDLMKGKAKLFVHSSFESYLGPGFEMPLHMFSAPLPQPNSTMFYGPLTTADPARSYLFNFFAKFTIGKVQLRVQAPYAERHTPLGFPGFVSRNTLPEDAQCNPNPPVYDPMVDPNDLCLDRLRTSRDNQINFLDRYVVAEYKSRTAGGKAGVNLKLYGVQFVRAFPQLGILAPIPTLLEGGLAFKFNATTYRGGANFDGDFELPGNVRVNYGAEAFKEYAQEDVERSIQGDGIEATFIGPYVLDRLPLPCPREPFTDQNGMRGSRIIDGCPLTFAFPSDRMVGGVYANPQWRPSKKLILDAGARLQISPESLGSQSYPLTRIFSGTAVWNFIPSWHLKLNYAEGFRPPVYNNNSSNGEAVQLDGGDLEVETSQAAQAEINARIFKGERRIRELSFRLDYSYTKLENLIQIVSGRYENTADRAMHGGEALAKLYIQGGHRIELAYTFLRVNTRDKGIHKSFPEHMFHLAGMYNVIDDKLSMFTDLRVVGAMEDPNRLVEYRDYGFDMDAAIPGTVVNNTTGAAGPLRVGPTDLTMDRLPPAADLSLGFTLTPMEKLSIRGTVFNAFNARYYQPDAFYDYEPRLEMLPNPWEDWHAYVSATYTH